jgi:hypothetical protein
MRAPRNLATPVPHSRLPSAGCVNLNGLQARAFADHLPLVAQNGSSCKGEAQMTTIQSPTRSTLLIRFLNTDNWVPHPSRVLCGMGGVAGHYLKAGSIVSVPNPLVSFPRFFSQNQKKHPLLLLFMTHGHL